MRSNRPDHLLNVGLLFNFLCASSSTKYETSHSERWPSALTMISILVCAVNSTTQHIQTPRHVCLGYGVFLVARACLIVCSACCHCRHRASRWVPTVGLRLHARTHARLSARALARSENGAPGGLAQRAAPAAREQFDLAF